jgi:hypothetical protein
MLKLRRIIWDNGKLSIVREDYEVIDERGEKIGRIYRTDAVGGGEAWDWTVYGIAVWNSPPAGREPTREQAMAAFKAAWGDVRPAGARGLVRPGPFFRACSSVQRGWAGAVATRALFLARVTAVMECGRLLALDVCPLKTHPAGPE